MLVEVLLFLLALLVYCVVKDRRPSGMPPGPTDIPFLGRMPVLNEKAALEYRKLYGNICTVRSGKRMVVLLFDYKTAKETFSKPEFSGRPQFFADFSLDPHKTGGVTTSVGEQWQHDRRFLLRNLRNLGMGKSHLETAVHVEAEALVEDLKKYEGKPINYPDSFRTAPLNVIWQMVADRRYDLRSTEVSSMYEATKEIYKNGFMLFMTIFFPVLKKLPENMQNWLFSANITDNYLKNMAQIVDKVIDEHEKKSDDEGPRDLIDEYLLELANKSPDNKFLRKGALRQIVADSFDAGSDTINYMLRWLPYVLVKYPEVTSKLQRQIDEVVPRDRLVSINNKPDLPYVEAFMTEVFRYSSMVSMNVEHTALTDAYIDNYFIPQGTSVVSCNYAIHRDPEYWSDPDDFKPERFIGKTGKFEAPQEGFIFFGIGRRQCPGEVLAKMEYFLYIATIVQNFDISVPDGVSFCDDVVSSDLGMRIPNDQKFIYKPRAL